MAQLSVAAELARYGPRRSGARRLSRDEAQAYCRALARAHYENFTVASWLLPRGLRPHFYAVYAYCRWADDLADETPTADDSLRLLDWWEDAARRAATRATPRHPGVRGARSRRFASSRFRASRFADLLIAFRQDQRVTRYETLDDVLGYCRNSANPVGRLVLVPGPLPRRAARAAVRLDLHRIATGEFLPGCGPRLGDGSRLSAAARRSTRPATATRCSRGASATTRFARRCASRSTGPRAICAPASRWSNWCRRSCALDVALFVGGGLSILQAIRRAGLRRVARAADGVALGQVAACSRAAGGDIANGGRQGGIGMNDALGSQLCALPADCPALGVELLLFVLAAAQAASGWRCARCMRFCGAPTTWATARRSRSSGARALTAWRESLGRALAGDFDDPLLPALADTVSVVLDSARVSDGGDRRRGDGS